MYTSRIAVLLLIIISLLKLSDSLPVVPGNNLLRLFYEKPEINALQGKLIQITRPQPVLDTLTPAEACCNYQQHLPGKKLLGVYENISSALATIAEVPKQTKNSVGAAVSDALNNIGGKIVGLQ